VRDYYSKMGQAFVLVYAINNRDSFDALETYSSQMLRVKDLDWFPLILIGYVIVFAAFQTAVLSTELHEYDNLGVSLFFVIAVGK